MQYIHFLRCLRYEFSYYLGSLAANQIKKEHREYSA